MQKRVVNVYRLITRGTLEEKIMGLQKFKMSIANTVISQDNASLQSMGTDQLLNLFSLDKVRPPRNMLVGITDLQKNILVIASSLCDLICQTSCKLSDVMWQTGLSPAFNDDILCQVLTCNIWKCIWIVFVEKYISY